MLNVLSGGVWIMIDINSTNFSTSNILGYLDSRWILSSGASISNNILALNPGSTAKIDATQTLVTSTFQACKLSVQYQSSVANSSNNFKSGPSIKVLEAYKNDNNEIYKSKHRCFGFNTFNAINKEANVYLDTTVYETLNKPIGKITLLIENSTTEVLYIQKIELFTSIDVNEEQLSSAVNNVISAGEPGNFITYTSADGSRLVALGVELTGTSKVLIFKPLYSDGKMIEVKTNFGQNKLNTYTTDEPDMTDINSQV